MELVKVAVIQTATTKTQNFPLDQGMADVELSHNGASSFGLKLNKNI